MTERFTDGVEEGAADFAIADLSVTSARNEAVEFSTPWMTLGISIIFQKPRQAPPGLMSFLSPFTVEVWIYISLGNMIIKLCICKGSKVSDQNFLMAYFTKYSFAVKT